MKKLSLFSLVVGVKKYEFIGIEENRIVEGVPSLLFEVLVIIGKNMNMISPFFLLVTLETI